MALKDWKRLPYEKSDTVKVAWRNRQDGDKVVLVIQPRFTKGYIVQEDNSESVYIISDFPLKSKSQAEQVAKQYMRSH